MARPNYIFYHDGAPIFDPSSDSSIDLLDPALSAGAGAATEYLLHLMKGDFSGKIPLKILNSPITGSALGTITTVGLEVFAAHHADERYSIRFPFRATIFFNSDGEVTDVRNSNALGIEVNGGDLIGGVAFGVLLATAVSGPALSIGAAIGASFAWSYITQARDNFVVKPIVNYFHEIEAVDVRFTSPDGIHNSGILVNESFSTKIEQYLYATRLIQQLSENLHDSFITFHKHDDGIRFGEVFDIFDGSVIEKLASYQNGVSLVQVRTAGPENGNIADNNDEHFVLNKNGDPYLFFASDDDPVIYAPIRGFDGTNAITDVKVHAVFEGGLTEAHKLFGPGSSLFDFEDSYNLVMVAEGQHRLAVRSDDTILLGSSQDEVLIASGDNVVVLGGDGRDVVRGGEGDDVLVGGRGRDIIFYKDGVDTIFGGDGFDRADFSGSDNGVKVNMSKEDHPDSLTMEGIEEIIGSNYDDFIIVNDTAAITYTDRFDDGDDVVAGGDGNDTFIDSTPGTDIYYGRGGADTFILEDDFGTILIGEIDADDKVFVNGVDLSSIVFAPLDPFFTSFFAPGILLGIDWDNDIMTFAFNGGEKSVNIQGVLESGFPINLVFATSIAGFVGTDLTASSQFAGDTPEPLLLSEQTRLKDVGDIDEFNFSALSIQPDIQSQFMRTDAALDEVFT